MRTFLLYLCFIVLVSCSSSETTFELEPSQSMVISGKGPGQDAAINPYLNQNCTAIVTNIGEHIIQVRIQEAGTVIQLKDVQPNESINFSLKPKHELYLDAYKTGKAKVKFKKTKP